MDACHTLGGSVLQASCAMEYFAENLHEAFPPATDESCQRVWVALLVQMIRDAASMSRKAEARRHRIAAIQWLFGRESEADFKFVCDMAGREPLYVRRKVMEARERNFIHPYMMHVRAAGRAEQGGKL